MRKLLQEYVRNTQNNFFIRVGLVIGNYGCVVIADEGNISTSNKIFFSISFITFSNNSLH